MAYKIVVDSSSNLKNDYLKDQDIGFEVVPLTIRVDDEIFVDIVVDAVCAAVGDVCSG